MTGATASPCVVRVVAVDHPVAAVPPVARAIAQRENARAHHGVHLQCLPQFHRAADGFPRGDDLQIAGAITIPERWLHHRHANQAERWQRIARVAQECLRVACIPAMCTDSACPLQCHSGCCDGAEVGVLPGLAPTLENKPYFTRRPH